MSNLGNQEVLQEEISRLRAKVRELEIKAKSLKESEEKHEKVEKEFAVITQNLNEVFWLSDTEKNQIIYVSPGYERIWKRTCQSLYDSPRSWLEAIHPADRERVRKAAITKQARGDYDEEYRITLPDSSIRWIRDRAFPIKNVKGKVHRITGIAEDITERKISQIALEENEKKYRQLFENASDGIVIFDAQTFQVEEANETFLRIMGYTRKECLLMKVPDFSAEPEKTMIALHQIRDGIPGSGKIPIRYLRRKNGEIFPTEISSGRFVTQDRIKLLGSIRDITERKKFQDNLFLSETRFRSLVEATSNIVFHINSKGRATDENSKWWANLTGQTEKESAGFGWVKALHPEDQERAQEAWTRSFQNNSKFDIEYRVFTKEKKYKHFAVRLVPIQNPIQKDVDWVGTMTDITDKKQSEEDLKKRKSELQILFDLIPAFIWYKDRDNNIINLNKRAAESMGKSVEEVQGKSTYDLYPKDAAKYHKDDLEVINSGKPKFGIVEQLVTREGRKIWIQTDKVPFYDHAGKVVGVVVCSQDITERKKAEEGLQESEARLRALLNAIPDKMLRIEKNGTILDFKSPDESLLFEATNLAKGKNIEDLLSNELYPQFHRCLKKALQSGLTQVFEFQTQISKVLYDYEARIVASGLDEAVVIIRNMTEYRRLEREMLEINESHKQRIGQDLHDGLGQHLTGIAFLSKVLAQKLAASLSNEAEEAQKIVQYVNNAISQTRTLARGLHPIELETNGLNSALQEMALQTEKLFRVRCRLECEFPIYVQNPIIATHLYRIVQEAVHNAIKHGKAKNLCISLNPKDDKIVLSVKDDGIGLPPELKRGKGMGLDIMRYRARAIGANLELKDGSPRGAVIQATFSQKIASQKIKPHGKKDSKIYESKNKGIHR